MLSLIAAPSALAEEQTGYDTRAEVVLSAVGVSTAFASKAAVTRGEFVAAVIDFMGIDRADKTPFYDVGIGDEYYSQICTAYELELISGREGRMFYPKDSITYNEAISICVALTGRKMYAAAHGGYPAGFNYAADAAKLGKNVTARGDTPLSGQDAVWLLFNTFSAEVLEQTSFGGDIEFSTVGHNTMFSLYKDVKVTEGIVNANRFSGLYAAEDMLVNRAKIGNVLMRDDSGLCDGCLGLFAEVYYTENDSEEARLIACIPDEKENSITRIEADDVVGLEDGYFIYEQDGRRKRKRIEPSVPVIYNRSVVAVREAELFAPGMGYVELIDNNGDGDIDAVSIIERSDYVVFAYDKSDCMLYDKYGKSLDLSANTDKFVLLRSADGEVISDAELEEKTIVTAEVSRNGKVVYAVVSSEKRYGSVTHSTADDESYQVTVSDEVLYVSPDFVKNIPYGFLSRDGGVFYLNAYGYIADFAQADRELVYVISAYFIEENDGISLRYMDRGGNIELVDFEEKYRINGGTEYASDGVPPAIAKGDVVLISRNADGKISSIDTPDSGSGIFSFGDMANLTYSKAVYSFNGNFTVGADTVVMSCPTPDMPYDENEYSIIGTDELADGESYTVRAFVTDENSIIPKVIVVYSGADSSIKKADDCVLVKKVVDTVNEDNEQIKRVYFFRCDKEAYVDCLDTELITDGAVGAGDIIKFSTNRKGYMTNVDKIYSAKTNGFNSASSFAKDNGMRNGFRLVGGNLYNREDNVIGIYDGKPAGISRTAAEYFTIPENVTGSIYVVNPDNEEVVAKGGMYSLKDYCHFGKSSKVLIYTRYAVMRMIVVYEQE